MSPIVLSAIILLVLLFLNVPVFAAITGACVAYTLANPSSGITAILAMQREISGMQSVAMLAIPFFVATGALMNYCGITDRMLRFCKVLTGHMYGGLGQVNIALSTLMGGMSGSSLADAAMEAKLLVPDMRKSGYPNGFASAITAASSMITPLIPPGNCGNHLRLSHRRLDRPPFCSWYCTCHYFVRLHDGGSLLVLQTPWYPPLARETRQRKGTVGCL